MTQNDKGGLGLFARCRAIDPARVAQDAGLTMVGRGARRYCCCPFHQETRPSLMVDDHGRWHCFGCGRGGDAVALYAGLRGIRPLAAARALAARYLGEAQP